MFGIEALNIVIGMIFIYLLFSLFVSIINEIIGNLFNSRGNKLFESIKELIGEEGINDLSKDPRIKVLTQKGSMISSAKADLDELKNTKWPEYIPESLFAEIIADLDNSKLGGVIGDFNDDVKNSSDKMKEVYETALLKTSQTYRQYARKLTLLVSILVVLAFNIDSIAIFKDLANNPEDAAIVAEMAENYLAANDSLDLGASDESIAELKLKLQNLQEAQLQDLESSLGFGWKSLQFWTELKWHTLPGWIITILALSLGAPFWFDLLKKVVSIKQELKSTK
ncbi:MAG: hypothetical protein ACPGGA_04275 [Balneolaceae bacterium]